METAEIPGRIGICDIGVASSRCEATTSDGLRAGSIWFVRLAASQSATREGVECRSAAAVSAPSDRQICSAEPQEAVRHLPEAYDHLGPICALLKKRM